MTELKFKLKLTNEDKNYYEEFVLTAKKENKALKEELLQFELGKKSVEDLPTLMVHKLEIQLEKKEVSNLEKIVLKKNWNVWTLSLKRIAQKMMQKKLGRNFSTMNIGILLFKKALRIQKALGMVFNILK